MWSNKLSPWETLDLLRHIPEKWLSLWQTRQSCPFAGHCLCLCLHSQFPHCTVTVCGSQLWPHSTAFISERVIISLICHFDDSALCTWPTFVARSKFSSRRSLSYRRSSVSPKTNLSCVSSWQTFVAYSDLSSFSLIRVKYALTDSSASCWSIQKLYRS